MNIADRGNPRDILKRIVGEEPSLHVTADELRTIIEVELAKDDKEVDAELVNACSRILADKYGITSASSEPDKAKTKALLHERIRLSNEKRRLHLSRFSMRFAAAISVLVIVALATELLLNRSPFAIFQSPDQEQLIVQGRTPDEAFVQGANAQHNTMDCIELDTGDLSQAVKFLGYSLALPTWLPEGVSLSRITATRDGSQDNVTIRYVGSEEQQVIVNYVRADALESVITEIEQNKAGKKVDLGEGKQVYVTYNLEVIIGMYINDNERYLVSCIGFDESTLLKIIQSIGA